MDDEACRGEGFCLITALLAAIIDRMRRLPLLLLLIMTSAQAQDGGNIHWTMAAYFGTGAYKVSDSKEVLCVVAVVVK